MRIELLSRLPLLMMFLVSPTVYYSCMRTTFTSPPLPMREIGMKEVVGSLFGMCAEMMSGDLQVHIRFMDQYAASVGHYPNELIMTYF